MESLPEKVVVALTCDNEDLMHNSVQAFLIARKSQAPGNTIVLACIVNSKKASTSSKLNRMMRDLSGHCGKKNIRCDREIRIEPDASMTGPAIVDIVKEKGATKLYLPTESKSFWSINGRRWGKVIDYCYNHKPETCEVISADETFPSLQFSRELTSVEESPGTPHNEPFGPPSDSGQDQLHSPLSLVSSGSDRGRGLDFLTEPSLGFGGMSPAQVQNLVVNTVDDLLRVRSIEKELRDSLQAPLEEDLLRSQVEKADLRKSLEEERREKEMMQLKLKQEEEGKRQRILEAEREVAALKKALEEEKKRREEAAERQRAEEERRLKSEAELEEERSLRMVERDAADARLAKINQEMESLALTQQQTECIVFPYEELVGATDGFANSRMIGQGGFGKVYLGDIRRMRVAIKRLDPDSMQGEEQLKKEVKVLNENRHPHLLSLLGACFEHQCIVFEYMECSLQDKLDQNSGAPLPWTARLRICSEVAQGLHFLHTARPPIIHRDIKPSNILLDKYNVSKISDAGLAHIAISNMEIKDTFYTCGSNLKGTFQYLDPEYIHSCTYSAKSDVFALGVVMGQLLTGQGDPVQTKRLLMKTNEEGEFLPLKEILDNSGGTWDRGIAEDFAIVIRKCMAVNRAARMDLNSLLTALDALRARAELRLKEREKRLPGVNLESTYPELFACPISWEVMEDPVLLADGHTYERARIEEWLAKSNLSPHTGLPLPDTKLIPNFDLRSQIMEWRETMARRAQTNCSSALLSS